jgi:hypothetical protein
MMIDGINHRIHRFVELKTYSTFLCLFFFQPSEGWMGQRGTMVIWGYDHHPMIQRIGFVGKILTGHHRFSHEDHGAFL